GGDGGCDRLRELLGERALLASRQHAPLGEPQIACHAEHGRLADRVRELPRRLERRVRLDRQHDEVGVPDDLLVAAAAYAELDRALPAALVIARADGDVEPEIAEPGRERAA